MRFEERHKLLDPGYINPETGFELFPDGAMHVAVLTRMPRCKEKWWIGGSVGVATQRSTSFGIPKITSSGTGTTSGDPAIILVPATSSKKEWAVRLLN
jgi:hypothetical protein